MDSMKKLMELKKGKKMLPVEKNAKMSVLHKLKSDMEGMMGDKLKGMKKVSVAASDKEGLEHGLDEAKHLLHNGELEPGHDEDDSSDEMGHEAFDQEEPEGSSEHENESEVEHQPEDEDESADLDKKIEELMKRKASLKK